ncbi:ABC transporter ATP-binding protein [Mycoplasma leonicaptivi]|uniref:ABC transporter ATP-binding protein n=1 Tax=Mycoplasma leonicaptivi TaxID=36742 RepID=UPI0005676D86|nr:ABC transporter ATP-binding protein [Mycoplasma leonicaptivi]
MQKEAKNFSSFQAFKILWSFLKIDKKRLYWAILFSFINVLAYIAGSFLLGFVITKFFTPLADGSLKWENFPTLNFFLTLLLLMFCYLIYGVFRYFENKIFVQVSFDCASDIRKKLTKKLLRLDISFYDRNKTGDLISTLVVDINKIAFSLNQVFSSFINAFLSILVSLISMFIVSSALTLIVIPLTLLMFGGVMLLLKKSQKHFILIQNAFGKLNAFVEETLSNTKVTNAFNQKDSIYEQLKIITKEIKDTAFKGDLIAKSFDSIYGVMSNVIILIITAIAALFYFNNWPILGVKGIAGSVDGYATSGLIVTFISLNWSFLGPFQAALGNIFGVQVGVASTSRIAQLLNEEEPIKHQESVFISYIKYDQKQASFTETQNSDINGFYAWKFFNSFTNKWEYKSIKGIIEFNDVYFKYLKNSENYQLKNASFKAKQGQVIAIVGPTGAGKTTIINLLSKYYDYEKGNITIDGFELKNIKTSDFRKILTIVLQDSFLFNQTVLDNLKLVNPNSTFEEIQQAAKLTQAHHFIMNMPDGYNTMIENNGMNISQGQRQLISLTRAILSNHNMLILDEATSNIDSSTEKIVQEAMIHLTKGKTSFVIAHRLSTIKNADMIIVVDKGEIIECGNHNELLDNKGFYWRLYNSQFENQN